MNDVNLKSDDVIDENVKNYIANSSPCCGTVSQIQLVRIPIPILSGAYND